MRQLGTVGRDGYGHRRNTQHFPLPMFICSTGFDPNAGVEDGVGHLNLTVAVK
jgi:hypothetical protein